MWGHGDTEGLLGEVGVPLGMTEKSGHVSLVK